MTIQYPRNSDVSTYSLAVEVIQLNLVQTIYYRAEFSDSDLKFSFEKDTHILYSHVRLFTRIFRSILFLLTHHTYIY